MARPKITDKAAAMAGGLTARRRRDEKRPKSAIVVAKGPERLPLPTDRAGWRKLIRSLPGYNPYAQGKGYKFDDQAATEAIDFFETRLHHVKGAKARQLFNLELWEQAIVANLFGWKDAEGLRRYRECLIFVPRKNGKTPLAACLLLYMLFEDGEPGAEIYGAAKEHYQATKVFEHALGMVLQDEGLKESCSSPHGKIYNGQTKAIQLGEETGFSTYRVICSDSLSAQGFNTHGAVIDELHVQPNRDLVDALTTSTGARRQPLILYLTTSDFEREGSICNEKHTYAMRVRDGRTNDPEFLPVIYQADKEDAEHFDDPKVWRKANPNLDVSLSYKHLERECRRAKEVPGFLNTFLRLHLNLRTQQDTRWLTPESWADCKAKFTAADLVTQPCYAGLDLAANKDITAFVLLFGDKAGGYKVLPYFWIPAVTARERSRRDKVDYEVWIREGLIETTEGNTTDYAVIRRRINEIAQDYAIREIVVDRLFQGAQLAGELMDDGFTVVAMGQGFWSMAAPTLEFETLVRQQKIQHNGNSVLSWMAGNVTIETDAAGCIKPSKAKSFEKIDGVVSTIMALSRAMCQKPMGSVYDTRELRLMGQEGSKSKVNHGNTITSATP